MRAAVFDASFDLQLRDVERTPPAAGEVEVRVGAAGLCAGDLYIYLGKNPYVTYPRVGGHEIAGVVSALGSGVTGVSIGERVVVDPFIGCGRCYACRVGKRNCCANLSIIGVHRDGGFAEAVRAPAGNLHRIPEGMSDFEASFAEPVAIGVQACRRGEIVAGDRVLVLGAGPIGLAIVEVARAYGAETFITDVKPERLETAQSLGAIPLSTETLAQDVLRLTNGEGMPVVIEATGVAAVMEQTIDLVAAGGRIVIVGLVKQGTPVRFPGLDLTRKEVTLHGSRASVDCFPESLRLLASGAIRYPRVATRVSIADAPQVFARLADSADAYHKAVFVTEPK
jgi:L-gulonate 5-dehydrogenase